MLEQLDIYMQKQTNKQTKNLTLFIKLDLNIKCKMVKLLEEKTYMTFSVMMIFFFFFDTTLNTWSLNEIVDKLDFIKIEIFCPAKDNVKRMRS